MSLYSFISDLKKSKSGAHIVIVDDNAQLTRESRIRASKSFATPTTSSLRCRWSSNPALNNPFQSPKQQRQKNASWGNQSSPNTTENNNKLQKNKEKPSLAMPSMVHPCYASPPRPEINKQRHHCSPLRVNVPVDKSPTSPKRRKHVKKSSSFTAPKLPERVLSPTGRSHSASLSTMMTAAAIASCTSGLPLEGRSTKLHRPHRTNSDALRSALGAMAPTTTCSSSRSSKSKKTKSRSSKSRSSSSSSGSTKSNKISQPPAPQRTNSKELELTIKSQTTQRELPSTIREFPFHGHNSPTTKPIRPPRRDSLEFVSQRKKWAGEVLEQINDCNHPNVLASKAC